MQRDEQIFSLICQEIERERHGIELIASENFTSPRVMQAIPALESMRGCKVAFR